MNLEKHLYFKSLGTSQQFRACDVIQAASNVELEFWKDMGIFTLKATMRLNEIFITILAEENGDRTISSDDFTFLVLKCEGEYHHVQCEEFQTDTCLKNGIFETVEIIKEERGFRFPVYSVKLNKALKIDFDTIPMHFKKYFDKSEWKMEKYSIFKSLGKPEKQFGRTETINLSKEVFVTYHHDDDLLCITQKNKFEENFPIITISDKDVVTVSSANFSFVIKNYIKGLHLIESKQESVDFFLQNQIIVSSELLRVREEFSIYRVNISGLLKFNFGTLPGNITKYFSKTIEKLAR